MDIYKFTNHKRTAVLKNSSISIVKDGNGWQEYLAYAEAGGITDPFKTFDEWVIDALSRLWLYHDLIISGHGLTNPVKTPKDQAALARALRKEIKGNASPGDIQLLNDNDTLDDWFDAMETAAESDGESWIEDSARTEQELIDFDPAVQVTWPDYPF